MIIFELILTTFKSNTIFFEAARAYELRILTKSLIRTVENNIDTKKFGKHCIWQNSNWGKVKMLPVRNNTTNKKMTTMKSRRTWTTVHNGLNCRKNRKIIFTVFLISLLISFDLFSLLRQSWFTSECWESRRYMSSCQ